MGILLVLSATLVVLVFVTRFLVGRNRIRELDRDSSIELSCGRVRALTIAAKAARGIMWQVVFTDNGLYTRHLFAHNVVHVAVSDHPRRPGRSTAKVWTRCRADDHLFFLRPKMYLDTKRKRDKIIRSLSALGTSAGRDDRTGRTV
jgi:hypothetical protein